ncbi:MAG: hypothetical protein DRN26_05880 [Thermoplasmata archaeon]|nr:MAG: hypothetical protein DRN26_05880 [Thermoplasmata archaeon]
MKGILKEPKEIIANYIKELTEKREAWIKLAKVKEIAPEDKVKARLVADALEKAIRALEVSSQ